MSAVDARTDTPSTVLVPETPYRSAVSNDTVLAFVSSAPQNTEHVLVVEANLSSRATAFHQGFADGETSVLGPDGTALLGDAVPDETAATVTAGGANASGFATSPATVTGYAHLSQLDWSVVTQVPASSAYGLRNQIGSSILLTLVSALVVLGGVTLAVGHRSASALSRLSSRAAAMRDGDLDVDLQSSRVDEIGRLFGAFDEMRDSLRDQIAAAETAKQNAEAARERAEVASEEAETARRAAEALNDRLEARATEYSEVMAACAEGDLSSRMDTDAENEAMARIATAYNEVMDEWESTIRQVRSFSTDVRSASDAVAEHVAAVRDRSDSVDDSAAEMADGAETQSEQLQSVLGELEDLSATVEEVSATADAVRTRADEALERGRNGREAASDAAEALAEIEDSTTTAVGQVEDLEALMADIEAVTDLISDVADQTNMLALNATIEAARADAGGEGFAVVADEVKQLADETVEATDDIEASIVRMREQVDRTVDEMHATQSRVSTGTETVEDALAAFDGIVDDIEETTSGMREIDRATAEQAESTQEVVSMVESVGDISDTTAAEASSVAAATTDQVAAVEDVETDVTRLSERAAELGALLETFDVSEDATATGAANGADDGGAAADRPARTVEVDDTDVFDPAVQDVADEGTTVLSDVDPTDGVMATGEGTVEDDGETGPHRMQPDGSDD
ncbi:methyl-accepting chemotaxis protein [Haloarcula halobia]|nr:methyl-accepting chemotaxis protein [Halomicroarcula sp. XH51]